MSAVHAYRALRILLFAISAIEAIAGLVLVFASSWVLAMTPANIGLLNNGVLLAFMKAIGIVAIALGYLLCAAARDPVRYVAVIDALVFILLAAAALNVYAVAALHIGSFFPGPYLIIRAVIQLILAVAIIALRPRRAATLQFAP